MCRPTVLQSVSDIRKAYCGSIRCYQKLLKNADAMDFGIVLNTIRLFRENKDILDYYQNKFKYIMVDEYQDEPRAILPYLSVSREAQEHMRRGRHDEYYRFQGATIKHSGESQYDNAVTMGPTELPLDAEYS